MKRSVVNDPFGEDLIVITGANCPVCESPSATIIAVDVNGYDTPLIKMCPCGHIFISKDFIYGLEIKSPELSEWL